MGEVTRPSSLTLPNDPDGEQEFFELIGALLNCSASEARAHFKEALGKFDEEGRMIQ
jgi:hypothetical protein